MEPKRLYRSRENRVLCGVCGGIAEYFNVDPVLIRLGMVLFICASVGTGLLAYFIASVITPFNTIKNSGITSLMLSAINT